MEHLKRCKAMDWPPDLPMSDAMEMMLHYGGADDSRPVTPPFILPEGILEYLSPLEKLPTEIIENIAKFLEYKDGINLGSVSKMMHHVKPAEMIPVHERYVFTEQIFTQRKAFPWLKRDTTVHGNYRSLRRLPCFVCFRIRDSEHFSDDEIDMADEDQETAWRMRCKECVHKMGVEGDEKLLRQFDSYEMCGECSCLKIKGKGCMNCKEWAGTVKMMKEGPRYPTPPCIPASGPIVGSFHEWEGVSYLRPDSFPLAKRPL